MVLIWSAAWPYSTSAQGSGLWGRCRGGYSDCQDIYF